MVVDEPSTTTDSDSLDAPEDNSGVRKRRARSFPAMAFEDALQWPIEILRFGSGQPVRRLSLLENLAKSPTSSSVRQLIASSNQYGLTSGGHTAETVEVTPEGRDAADPSTARRTQAEARFNLAINGVPAFKQIFERYYGNRLPAREALKDAIREIDVPDEHVAECVDTFLANARFVGVIRPIAGSEHLVSLADALDHLPDLEPPNGTEGVQNNPNNVVIGASARGNVTSLSVVQSRRPNASLDLSDVCFIVSPIGEAGSEQRKHADLVLDHLITPALEPLGLRPVRADAISIPGMITGQVMQHLARAKLVIADLSFANPNVYYELAVRHAARKPAVQLTRSIDKIPFDVGQFRTVVIDMSDIYTLIPAMELHISEISRQARASLNEMGESENPISKFYPDFWDELENP